ncbi:thiamine diphosphokinase [Bacillus massilinigeriensis]|uniref:thiamine diphosphokinase n=1 Tax=Bacillus mediterraneensis TaxID=1805474 RepID=UPI0008F8A48A|nr:thiamine diphosphokinase [Bacillus mediterraneensis]
MVINIVAGGPDEFLPELKLYNEKDTTWVGVDRGVITLLSKGIQPKYAFGDFDSIESSQLEEIRSKVGGVRSYIPEKDATDMELALEWALTVHPEKIRLFGATGGRIDHMLANIQLLVRGIEQKSLVPIEIIDSRNSVFAASPGEHEIAFDEKYKYVSLIPITMAVKGITLIGFKYPLKDQDIRVSSTLCISNELTGKTGTFSFKEGIVLVVRSSD